MKPERWIHTTFCDELDAVTRFRAAIGEQAFVRGSI
jgi:hypothetical protein